LQFAETLEAIHGKIASLRPLAMSDLDVVYSMVGDGVVIYNVFDPVKNKTEAENWLSRGTTLEPGFGGNWLIIDNASQRPAGLAMYYGSSPWTSRAGIAYCLLPEFRGRGLASASVKMMIHHLLFDVGLNRLEAEITLGNETSIAVVKRLSFTFEGTLRERFFLNGAWKDALMYSFLKSDIQQRVQAQP
jgi:[ribosomal protein S5]-alanine N-acetyltransferase